MTTMYDSDDEDIDLDEERPRRGQSEDLNKPVSNAKEIPLFADADKRQTNTASYIKITKLDSPGKGYKGQMPISTTLEMIGGKYGNGMYSIHLCNENHKVLRKLEGVEISLSDDEKELNGGGNNSSNAADQHLAFMIKEKASTDNRVLERERERNKEHSDMVTTQATQFADMVTKTTEAAAQRDREHMKGVNESQQNFFANMLQQSATQFQQTIAMMVMSHNQTMEALRASHERDMQSNNPATLMEVLLKGISIGKEFDGDDDPEWIKGISAGGDVLDKLLQLQKGSDTPTQTSQLPKKANPSKPTNNAKEPVFTKTELREMLKLKKVLRSRGIELEDQLMQASKHYADIPEEELYSETKEKSEDTPDEGKIDDSATKETS